MSRRREIDIPAIYALESSSSNGNLVLVGSCGIADPLPKDSDALCVIKLAAVLRKLENEQSAARMRFPLCFETRMHQEDKEEPFVVLRNYVAGILIQGCT